MKDSGSDLEAKTKKEFGEAASTYATGVSRKLFFRRFYARVIQWVEREGGIRLREGAAFLDVACGTAEIIGRLAEHFPASRFTGADFTKEMLDEARRHNGHRTNLHFLEADALALPFGEGTFDFVLCTESFHHFSDPEKALKEFRRVLRPGGALFLVDIGYDTMWQKAVCRLFFRLLETVKKYYSRDELGKLLAGSGFRSESAVRHGLSNYVLARK